MIGIAQTGSGKTLAYLLPLVSKLATEGPKCTKSDIFTPQALVLVPTRELAIQVCTEAKKLLYKTNIIACAIYGGVKYFEQKRELEKGADLIISTPGRLNDFLNQRVISLRETRFLVLDEADRMLDQGFTPQLIQIANQSDMRAKEERQNLMFSATFEPEVIQVAQSFLKQSYLRLASATMMTTNKNIFQDFVVVEGRDKLNTLVQILSKQETCYMSVVLTSFLQQKDYLRMVDKPTSQT